MHGGAWKLMSGDVADFYYESIGLPKANSIEKGNVSFYIRFYFAKEKPRAFGLFEQVLGLW